MNVEFGQEPLWTSNDVARALGVGVSSIKRWTDSGKLASVRTVGGHRRYRLEAIHAFASSGGLDVSKLPPLERIEAFEQDDAASIMRRLLADLETGDVASVRRIVGAHLALDDERIAFLDTVVGELLREIGEKWERGEWSVGMEHRTSYAVAEAIDRSRPAVSAGPLATLCCPPGELHSIPLNMVRIVLEWSDFHTDFLGADVPWDSIRSAIDAKNPAMVLLSARNQVPFNAPEFRALAGHCRQLGVELVIGGQWARGGVSAESGVPRFRTLTGFDRWLRTRDDQRMAAG
ncbi:MAG: helix-turn-helix domain-containing protein [Thermoanaerobaculia bacterium]